jgi:hypothetical protein
VSAQYQIESRRLLTDYPFGPANLVPYNPHLVFDLSGVALLIAPFVLGLGFAATVYYPIMAIGVFAGVRMNGIFYDQGKWISRLKLRLRRLLSRWRADGVLIVRKLSQI